MTEPIKNQFQPNIVFPPGDTLQEILDTLGMTQAQLSERMGRPKKTINRIIKGEVAITPDTAIQLERVLVMPASFWNNLEYRYQEHLARLREEESLAAQTKSLEILPIHEMIKFGWIKKSKDSTHQVEEVLNFFGFASLKQFWVVWNSYRYQVTFRKSKEGDWGSIFAWLHMGEILARDIECNPYDSKKFYEALIKIRSLTVKSPDIFVPKTRQLCSKAGVAIVFVPQLPKTRSSGAARWLTPNKALIQISLRYKTDDQVWFSFFHEAAHILSHRKRPIFLDGDKMLSKEGLEEEANRFAAEFLIPDEALRRFIETCPHGRISKLAIREFASELHIAPGIIVGRLQHDGHLPFSHCNDLKRKFEWVKDREH